MIGFAGLSHLGIVSSIAAAAQGFDVVGFDENPQLCDDLARGQLPLHEPGLKELFETHRSQIIFSSELSTLNQCDVIFISVDVPTDASDHSDLSPISGLLDRVITAAKPGTTIVVLSQVQPGFTRKAQVRAERNGGQLYYQVETLIFGRAVDQAVHPERFIVGCADPTTPLPSAFQKFLEAFGCPILVMRYESAELCKISINTFLVAQVSTTNMLAEICEGIGAEWREIAPALCLDRRIGPYAYLKAGLGLGGGNLQRDMVTVTHLASEVGADASVIQTWAAGSLYRREWALRVLHREVLTRCDQPTIGIWGLAYKEHTQSTRNSPAVHLLEKLTSFDVAAYDPAAVLPDGVLPHVHRSSSPLDACQDRDALVVMTAWPEFADIDLSALSKALRGRVVIDPLGLIASDRAQAEGLRYFRLGTGRFTTC